LFCSRDIGNCMVESQGYSADAKSACSPTTKQKLMEEGLHLTVRKTFIHLDVSCAQGLRRCQSDPMVFHKLQGFSEGAIDTVERCSWTGSKEGTVGSNAKLEKLYGPIVEKEQFPSIGSMTHDQDKCRACVYFYKNKCLSGSECLYCHFPHESSKRPGKNKRRRNLVRSRREDADRAHATEVEDSDQPTDVQDCG